MTIGEAVEKAAKTLEGCSYTPWLDASVILSHVLGKERWYLAAHDDEIMAQEASDVYFKYIDNRLSGMPVQYITGHQEFMSLNFFVNQMVLIPRPDTEVLVEEVLNYISSLPKVKMINAVDVGTGSGCIAVSIAKHTNNTSIKAVDISREALAVARMNAENLGVDDRIEFIESDLFEKLEGECFDIIIANPPYISSGEIESLQIEVRENESRLALDGGGDGLDYYRRLISEGYGHLNPGGLMAFEIGCSQAEQVKRMVEGLEGYHNFRIIRDLAGRDRVVTFSRKI